MYQQVIEPVQVPEELLDDWKWVFEQMESGQLSKHCGQHIAAVDKQILGSGINGGAVLDSVCAKYHLDPERVILFFVDPPAAQYGWRME